MKKSIFKTMLSVVLLVCLASSVLANSDIKLFFNGQEVQSNPSPRVIDENVWLPANIISELFGSTITWDKDTNSIYIDSEEAEIQKSRINLLEQALTAKDPFTAVKTWAEGVKTRNGALQYAIMSPELKEETYDNFVQLNWTTGTSSPWVKSYEISEKYRVNNETYRYEVKFIYTDSTSSTFSTRKYINVSIYEDNWLVSSIENIDIKGKITEIVYDDEKKVKSIFVEDDTPQIGSYDKGNVIIGENTKIYSGYTDVELKESDLKVGLEVEVTFTDDPRIMIYPVTAEAKIIRVKQEEEQANTIVYDNTQYGFRFLLPEGWADYKILLDKWEGLSIGNWDESEVVETGPVVYIRHPQWTSQNPRQDIPVMIFTIEQWNLLQKSGFRIGAAPIGPTELGRNNKYVFALPARYNYSFPEGYEEVESIINNNSLKPYDIS